MARVVAGGSVKSVGALESQLDRDVVEFGKVGRLVGPGVARNRKRHQPGWPIAHDWLAHRKRIVESLGQLLYGSRLAKLS